MSLKITCTFPIPSGAPEGNVSGMDAVTKKANLLVDELRTYNVFKLSECQDVYRLEIELAGYQRVENEQFKIFIDEFTKVANGLGFELISME